MQAIETIYNGYRFRSRLEARWATFFDALGIKYEYEKEGYDLDGTWYLPDFWLPELKCFVEIKGQKPDNNEWEKCVDLCIESGRPVYLLVGPIGVTTADSLQGYKPDYTGCIFHKTEQDIGKHYVYLSPCIWAQCDQCDEFGLMTDYEHFSPADLTRFFCECHRRYRGAPLWGKHTGDNLMEYIKFCLYSNSDNLIKAYTAARQARFEYGR